MSRAAQAPAGQRSPQIGRIARLLKVEPDQVLGLDDVPDEDLRAFHDQIGRLLFSDGEHRFARIAGLSKVLPGPIAGKLAERFLPAEMAARVAVLLEPARARDLVNRVSVPYLGDIALALDPVRSRPVVQQIPAERVGEVARELFGRHEYAAMAEFVGTVTVECLHAALRVATGHDLLAVVPLLEWNANVDTVIAELPPAQVDRIVAELNSAELAELAMALDPARFGPIVSAIEVETVAEIAEVLFARDQHDGMARFVTVVTPEMLHAALEVASGRDLLIVVPLLEWTAAIEQVVEEVADHVLDRLIGEIAASGSWAEAHPTLERIGPVAQQRLLDRLEHLPASERDAVRTAAAAGELGPSAAALIAEGREQKPI